MSIFGSRQKKTDYLKEIHPYLMDAHRKLGLVTNPATGELCDLSQLTENEKTDLYKSYRTYLDTGNFTKHSLKHLALLMTSIEVVKSLDHNTQDQTLTKIANPPPNQSLEIITWDQRFAYMQEDAALFLDRLQASWQRSAKEFVRKQTGQQQGIQNFRDALAAVAAQAGDQHAALIRLANSTPTVGTLNAVAQSGHHPEM